MRTATERSKSRPGSSSKQLALAAPVKSKTGKSSAERKLRRLSLQSDALKKVGTTFGVPSKQLYSMIQEGQVDQAIPEFQKQMLATVLGLIPIAEKQYRREKKEHTAYALNSLVSQARELSADIQASADRSRVAELIVTDLMMPTFRAFVEALVTETQTLKASLKSKVRSEAKTEVDAQIDLMVRSIAQTGNALFSSNANSIRDLLGAQKRHRVSK